jgi:uncharacterized protein YdaU (DUF1376 family)
MHFYSFNIKEYCHATAHLTNEECLAYRRILDMYYDREAPINLDIELVARRVRCEVAAVRNVLQEFFIQTEDGWVQPRVPGSVSSTSLRKSVTLWPIMREAFTAAPGHSW